MGAGLRRAFTAGILLLLPLLASCLVETSTTVIRVSTKATMRHLTAFLFSKAVMKGSRRSSQPLSQMIAPHPRYHRHMASTSMPKAGTRRHSGRMEAEDAEESGAAFAGRTLEELREVSYYFPDVVDNSTEYFLTTKDYESPIHAMVAELGLTMERATKIHQIGASYLWTDKFRRTHHPRSQGRVPANTCFRVYIYPRVFRACYVDYSDRIIHEGDDLIVADKPPGVPCAPHVSNAQDCLDVVMTAQLGIPPLTRMNRLDTCTTGAVALAKTKAASARYQGWIRDFKVRKVYRALLQGPVPVGPALHYMPPGIFHRRPAPRVISRIQHPGWKDARAEILTCKPVDLPHLQPQPPNKQQFHEVEVELITGRTHQLRAQFAALGGAIHGDDMYIPLTRFLLDDLEDPRIHELYHICKDPEDLVALQCARLEFDGKVIEANTPWWRLSREVLDGPSWPRKRVRDDMMLPQLHHHKKEEEALPPKEAGEP